MGQKDPYEVALRLAQKKLSKDSNKRQAELRVLAMCERLRGRIDTGKYWGMRLDKALSRGDFHAALAYLPKIDAEIT